MNAFCAGDRTLLALETNAMKMRSNFSHSQSHATVATTDFRTEVMSKRLLVTATHLQKEALSCMALNWFQVNQKLCLPA